MNQPRVLLLSLLFCIFYIPGVQASINIFHNDTSEDNKGERDLARYYEDNDMDGYGDPNKFIDTTDPMTIGYVSNGDDCDDTNPMINPGATEVEDGVDNNCDGQIDEGFGSTSPIALSDESFEAGFGDWIQESSDGMDWTRDSGGTPSTGTGPTTGDDGAYYLYLEASGDTNKRGILKSPLYSVPANTSMEFGYHMYGSAMGNLTVEVSTDSGSSWSSLWTKSGDQGNQWYTASIDLSAYGGNDVIIRFNGLTGSSYTSDISIDNIAFIQSVITPSDESFESGLGVWVQSSSDDMDWTRQSGGTTSGSTGPSGAYDGTYYLYTESSSPNYPSKSAIITSPEYDLAAIDDLSFKYHMYGAAMGSVSLRISTNGGSSWQTLWSKSGDQGNAWQSASVDLSSYSGGQLRFSAVTGSNYTSDLAIDNLVFSASSGAPCATPILSNENYVYTRTYLDPMTTSPVSPAREEVIEEVTYYDGLGRPMQQIGIQQAGGTGYEDIVTHIGYDQYGRENKSYLPYPDNSCTPGEYKTGDVVLSTQTYYQGAFDADFTGLTTTATNPYSEKHFEASPLNRVLEQGAPGKDWKVNLSGDTDHTIKFSYETNTHDPSSPTNPTNDNVRLYTVSLDATYTPTLNLSGYYNAGELYKNITKDENWQPGQTHPEDHTAEEFTDKQGQVILKRTYNNGEAHDTYYVYDDYGNLTYVLPPKVIHDSSISTTEKNELCYQYKYDRRNRLAEKKLPGKGWEYIVYNKLDQPVLTQDAVQRTKNEWLFTKYDAFGRVAFTGLKIRSISRDGFQTSVESVDQYVNRTTGANSYGGTTLYYSNNVVPTSMDEIYTINYYDSYDNLNIGFTIPNSNSLGETIVKGTGTKGLATVTKTRVLGASQWITTAMGYDNNGRVVWTKTDNPYLGTTDIIENKLDFTGTITQTKTTHQKTGKSDIETLDTFEYDHMKRLTKHTQSINGGAQELIAENTYDELGQLKSKDVGNTQGSPLQNVDYEYNVRGWLKQINDVGNTDKLFNFKISYNDPATGTPLYNGNISRTDWRTDNDDSNLKNYRYYYDALNRLNTATANSYYYNVSNIGYDKNGNIQSLDRMGPINSGATSFGNMDDLVYTYDGNKLRKVTDTGNSTYGFKDGSNTGDDYAYDPNGNLTSDANKGITAITYNHLNLPVDVEFNNSSSETIHYTYDATGTKLRKVIPGKTTDYAGNFIYEGGTLQFFSTPEGYVSYDNGQFNYVYNYVDHLGNVRLSYTDGDGNGSIDPSTEIIQEKNYYPFGLTHEGYNGAGGGIAYGNAAANRYGFGGKELQDETFSGNTLDWYDISARNYDPALGRWMNLDPLAEDMRRHSPYNYAFDNPIYFVDPDGMAPACTTCPWPNALGELRSLSNYLGNKIDSNLKSLGAKINNIGNSISNALDFEPRGGVVGYADGGFTKNGLVEPRKAQSGDDVTYADLTGVMVAAEVHGPQMEGKIAESAQLASDLIANFLSPTANNGGETTTSSQQNGTSNSDTPKERYVITKYMTYPSEARKFQIDTVEGNQDDAQKYRDSLDEVVKPYWNGPEVRVDSTNVRKIE